MNSTFVGKRNDGTSNILQISPRIQIIATQINAVLIYSQVNTL